MRKIALLTAVLAILAFPGCGPKPQPKPPRVVTAITVNCENCASLQRRYYNADEKMQLILQKIREIGLRDTPDVDPDTVAGRTIHITVTFSDGAKKIYSQKGDRYFREGNGPWTQVNPEAASQLYVTILLTPSDVEQAHAYRPHLIQLPGTGLFAPVRIFSEKTGFFKNSA